jgi:hypothetical protein
MPPPALEVMSGKQDTKHPELYYREKAISPGPGAEVLSIRENIPGNIDSYLDLTGSQLYLSLPSWTITVGAYVHRNLPGI